jgi:hypothetical protein
MLLAEVNAVKNAVGARTLMVKACLFAKCNIMVETSAFLMMCRRRRRHTSREESISNKSRQEAIIRLQHPGKFAILCSIHEYVVCVSELVLAHSKSIFYISF